MAAGPEGRRAHLLAWLQLAILLLACAALALVLIVGPTNSSRYWPYVLLISALIVFDLAAYRLNWTGKYRMSAALTVMAATIGPWGSAALDPTVFRGDFVPLTYVVLPVLLSSVLLHPAATTTLAAFQVAVLALVARFVPATASVNWPSLVSFVGFTSALSILASVVSQRDLAQIDRQTQQLALSEANMRELSIRDPLTNLYNRRYMEETLAREIQRAAREGTPLGVVMIDIDYFKRFNDGFGHAAGDALLQELGKELSAQVRSSDVACRYGGEEFVLIMPDASLEVARLRAERVRDVVKHLRVEHDGRALGTVTVSLGVAVFPDHGSGGEAVLESADSALYRAKREGRDCVVAAD